MGKIKVVGDHAARLSERFQTSPGDDNVDSCVSVGYERELDSVFNP
jgi:hypothetical protein